MIQTEASLKRLQNGLGAFCILTSVLVVGLGGIVIFGWHIGSQRLVQIRPSFAPMQYNAALGFIFCGAGLAFLLFRQRRWAAIAGGIASGIGALTLIQYIGDVNLGIDQLLMTHNITTQTSHPGRMAPNSALCFVLCGIGIATYQAKSRSPITVLLASLTFGLGIVAFSGYFTHVELAYGWGNWTRMAIHTSLGFVLLSGGLLTFIWSEGLQADASPLPKWLPIPIAVSLLTATLCLWQDLSAEGARIIERYPELTRVANIATVMLVVGVVFALAATLIAYLLQHAYLRAQQLDKANMSLWGEIETRKEAEKALQIHRDNLEQTVASRTRELEIARREAETANRAKSEFLSHMSHELRTPLNGILGYAQILQRHAKLQENERQQLDAIINCGDHLLSLINDVLDLSKIEAQQVEVDLAPLELATLVQGVADIVRERAHHKGIALNVDIAPTVPSGIITDGAKLRQILVNLLGNAVKFTEQGSVALQVSETPPNTLRFVVTDTGIGMSPDELAQIFDPFKQVEAGKAAGGTGLGLAITKNLAEILNATVSVESRLGAGSTFSVALPLVKAPPASWQSGTGSSELDFAHLTLAEGQCYTILIADDREANRDVLSGMLTPLGFQVRLATDGDEAIDQLRAHADIALTLMDVRMPRVSGIEAIQRIRQDEQLKQAKVIAVTASVYPEFRQTALAAGFDDFLGKPLRIDELLSRLKKHLALRFVPTTPKPETGTEHAAHPPSPAASTSIKDAPLATQQRQQLQAALRVKNVTALKAIGRQLEADPPTTAWGKRILMLASRFDFAQLADLLDEREQDNDRD